MTNPDPTLFETYRPLMFSIAYRMLGSATEAEDILQEAFIRYQSAASEDIVAPKAYFSTIVTRLCLNQLQSARSQRETYIGPWLPEPLLTPDDPLTPAHQAELHESISIAFLTLLEQLTPLERAVLLLRDVFDYDYAEIAPMLDREEATCRQIYHRARQHIADQRPRFPADPELHRAMLDQFIHAVSEGDLDGLLSLLSQNVTLWADGGGKARGALLVPLHGPTPVAKFLIASTRFGLNIDLIEIAEVNGEPTIVLRNEGAALVVLSITVENGHITTIRAIGNPDKLNWINEGK